MFFTILFVFGCKENAFFSNSRRKYEIPLKLTIAKGIAFREETLQRGLQFISIWCYRLILLQTYVSIQVLCCLSIALLHAYSMGVLLSLYLYSIFVPYFDLYFLLLWLPSLYHLAFYSAKVWQFCQIPNTRRCLIRLKLFRNAFHKCCTFGFSKKLSTELFGVLSLGTTIS